RLRTLLEAAEKRSAEEQRRRENAEKLAKEEQRKGKEEEERNEKSRPQALPQYLEACHSLSLGIQVVTEMSLTTQGDTTNPTGRIYPRRIVPWDDYPNATGEHLGSAVSSPALLLGPHFPLFAPARLCCIRYQSYR
ncbi:hypothetical protein F5Y17DRAFT_453358, partial [Xylariaceae sp. FL0594]